MERKLEIREKMYQCVETSLTPLMGWSADPKAEKELLYPIVSMKHMCNAIDYIFDRYADKIDEETVKDDCYYVNIAYGHNVHPAYLVGTLMTLLMANPKEIWVECFLSREEMDYYYGDPVTARLLKRMLKVFSELKLLKNPENSQRAGIDFVNAHPEITHVVEFGNQRGVEWRMKFFRKDITVHMPTANFVFVNYSSEEALLKDRNLWTFGDRCWYEVFDYECWYDLAMDKLDEEEIYVGMAYYQGEDLGYVIHNGMELYKEAYRISDRIPVYVFADDGADWKRLIESHDFLYPVTKENFSLNEIFYDFTDLLKIKGE